MSNFLRMLQKKTFCQRWRIKPFTFNMYWTSKQIVPAQIYFVIEFQSFAEVFMLTVQRFCFCCTRAMFVPLILPVKTRTSSVQEAAVTYNMIWRGLKKEIENNSTKLNLTPINDQLHDAVNRPSHQENTPSQKYCSDYWSSALILLIKKLKLIPEFSCCRMKQVRPTFHHIWKQVLKSDTTA